MTARKLNKFVLVPQNQIESSWLLVIGYWLLVQQQNHFSGEDTIGSNTGQYPSGVTLKA